jgi:hypothetical protein
MMSTDMKLDQGIDSPACTAGAPGAGSGPSEMRTERRGARQAARYLLVSLAAAAGGLGLITMANRQYAPEMYEPSYMATVAEALAAGESYAVFDLNINIRKLRDEHLQRLPEKPNVIIFGASQWQEASADLTSMSGYYNSHVHRDYYEDVLGMTEVLVRHEKLPRHLVITVRDRMFTPVGQRTDFLWLPGIPYFQAMAKRLGLQQHGMIDTYPLQRPRELLSLAMLFGNATRWHNATDWPYPTAADQHATLDLLRPDGSIRWSNEHQALFTQDRSRKLALEHAAGAIANPPMIDPRGVEALDTLLAYLGVRGVKVHLAHPPFNPKYFDAVKGTAYMTALSQVEGVVRELAAKHKLSLVGSFNPADLGCTAEMFIDAEHAQAPCLRRLLADVANSVDLASATPLPNTTSEVARHELVARLRQKAGGWVVVEREADAGAAVAQRAPSTVARTAGAPPPVVPVATTPAAMVEGPVHTAKPVERTLGEPARRRRPNIVQARAKPRIASSRKALRRTPPPSRSAKPVAVAAGQPAWPSYDPTQYQ